MLHFGLYLIVLFLRERSKNAINLKSKLILPTLMSVQGLEDLNKYFFGSFRRHANQPSIAGHGSLSVSGTLDRVR